jgi:hypothetical protein
MKRFCQAIGAAVLLCVVALRADALVHSAFEGLDHLIERSDHVVVAMVVSPPPGLTAVPATQIQKIQVTRVLKGSIQTRTAVEARLVPSMMGPLLTGGAVAEFVPAQYYVLFLNGGQPPYAQNLTPGSAFWIASAAAPPDRQADTRAAIEDYLEATAAYLETRRASINQSVREYLGEAKP